MSWAVATRAHVSTVKFTSGSRLRSSRPRILRSLVATILRGSRPSRSSAEKKVQTLSEEICQLRSKLLLARGW